RAGVAAEGQAQVGATGRRGLQWRLQFHEAVRAGPCRERGGCQDRAFASGTQLELAVRGHRCAEATLRFFLAEEAEVVRNPACAHFHRGNAFELRVRPSPARMEDGDVEAL